MLKSQALEIGELPMDMFSKNSLHLFYTIPRYHKRSLHNLTFHTYLLHPDDNS